jgi:DedD protein
MDRALKERIIGAAVLVVFVVLVVPVFLDGPPDNGEIVSERVPLPGQAAEGETRTVVLERDRDEPVPAAAVEPETRRPQPAQTGAAEQPESKPEPDPAPETEPHERLAADLRKQGFAAFLSQLSKDSGQLHRVRIGPQKDRESAEAMAERLAKAGHKGQVVPHP